MKNHLIVIFAGKDELKGKNFEKQVMDTPGLCDTDGEDDVKLRGIKNSLFGVHPGPHALLVVLLCNARFTMEESEVYQKLQDIFDNKMTNHLIVIFAGKDELKGKNFEEQVMDTPGLCDTDGEDYVKLRGIKNSLFGVHPGPHALLVVLLCNARFTMEESEVYQKLQDIFDNKMTNHLIVIFAGKDELKGQNFEEQMEQLLGVSCLCKDEMDTDEGLQHWWQDCFNDNLNSVDGDIYRFLDSNLQLKHEHDVVNAVGDVHGAEVFQAGLHQLSLFPTQAKLLDFDYLDDSQDDVIYFMRHMINYSDDGDQMPCAWAWQLTGGPVVILQHYTKGSDGEPRHDLWEEGIKNHVGPWKHLIIRERNTERLQTVRVIAEASTEARRMTVIFCSSTAEMVPNKLFTGRVDLLVGDKELLKKYYRQMLGIHATVVACASVPIPGTRGNQQHLQATLELIGVEKQFWMHCRAGNGKIALREEQRLEIGAMVDKLLTTGRSLPVSAHWCLATTDGLPHNLEIQVQLSNNSDVALEAKGSQLLTLTGQVPM